MELKKSNLEDLLTGAGFYASGGGGDINLVRRIIDRIFSMPNKQDVILVEPNSVPDTEHVSVVAMAGDPSKFDPDTLAQYGAQYSIAYLSQKTGKEFNYLAPIEIGANTIIPMLVAAQTGKKVINCSGTPRAVPRLQDTKFYTHGVSIAPVAFASDHENTTTAYFSVDGNKPNLVNVDGVMRDVVESEPFNGTTGFAGFVMNGSTMKKSSAKGTISKAMNLGNALNNLNGKSAFNEIQKILNADGRNTYLLAEGKITSIENTDAPVKDRTGLKYQQEASGFQYLKVTITATDNSTWIVKAVNENLIVLKDNKPQVIGPDLISYVNKKGEVFSNTNIKKDDPILLIGTQATLEMRDPKIVNDFLEILKTLDYNDKYIPIENLQKNN